MSSLQDSLRLKAASVKAPAVSGQAPLYTPDTPLDEGKSGGIKASLAKKNAASTPNNGNGVDLSGKFAKSIGIQTSSDKTVGYF